MSKGCCIGHVVYRHKLNIFVVQSGAHDVAPDASKPIDSNFNRHSSSVRDKQKAASSNQKSAASRTGNAMGPLDKSQTPQLAAVSFWNRAPDPLPYSGKTF